MNYPSIRIEGAILSPDILDRLDDLPGQRPHDFGFDSSVKVKDEIARAWADAQDYWRIFQRKVETLKADSPATTETRNLWIVPLLGLLGYQLEYQARGVELNGKNYPISHRVTNRGQTALHIVGYRESAGLDRKPERTTVRMSAHALVQEYLNLCDHVYGLVTNGRLLRLLRDSSRLVKLTYLEFDLDRIFTDGLFADFAILYRLLHASRLPASLETPSESIIERYHQDSLESGARIRDGLSRAVEQAILAFANGFLAHPNNDALRQAVARGELKPDAYYHHLLRLIYRLLFLLVIEERDLVYPSSVPSAKREVYDRYYSLQRLRRLSEKRYLADHRHNDLWLSMLATFRLFESDGPGSKLGLAPLAGDLFGPDAIGPLSSCTLNNDVLLGCLRSLGLYQHPDTGQVIRVNYAALNVEEFGSVYEGLLEFEPVFHSTDNQLEFAFAKGDERAATGSHYTPDELVQPLLKHSLDYLITDKLKESDKERALLSLRVADIACGSGHILLAAARRIATELAVVRTGEEQPSPTAFRTAVRDVIRECIYGVDYNPLAVELCKVALWLEAHSPGQPLNFLDHHIKNGNAIVGYVRRDELERGVPDEAFATMLGDDKDVAAEFRKQNKAERRAQDQTPLNLAPEIRKHLEDILQRWREVSGLPERTPDEIATKKRRYQDFTKSQDAWLLNQVASIPIAQFYLPKTQLNHPKLITDAEFRLYWSGQRHPQGQATAAAWATALNKRFFHWFLEFPEIIERGGFDCILGNPPYLGGKKLSGTYGYPFCGYATWMFAPAGLSDLVVFFLHRFTSLLRPGGFEAFITTNSIKDGAIREDGLDIVVKAGNTIVMAVRGVKWPGRANLVVSLLSIHRGVWQQTAQLDGRSASSISSFLEEEGVGGVPVPLKENLGQAWIGWYVLGDGFFMNEGQAQTLIEADQRYADVLFPSLNGQELNSAPIQHPTRWAINLGVRSEDEARQYPQVYCRVEELVKPERASKNRSRNRDYWWQYAEVRPGLTAAIRNCQYCFVASLVSKHLSFVRCPAIWIFTHRLCVVTSERWEVFCSLQSTIHEVWARKYSGTLETRLNYSPSDCLVTFPFPHSIERGEHHHLSVIGELYHEHRRLLMLQIWLGLTDIYNLFHARNLAPELVAKVSKKSVEEANVGYQGLLTLRRLHQELDEAVRDAYGWQDLKLDHDFYEIDTLPENDRVRYTISPAARKEVLRRLLALNHDRAKAEQEAISSDKKPHSHRTKKHTGGGSAGLFSGEENPQVPN